MSHTTSSLAQASASLSTSTQQQQRQHLSQSQQQQQAQQLGYTSGYQGILYDERDNIDTYGSSIINIDELKPLKTHSWVHNKINSTARIQSQYDSLYDDLSIHHWQRSDTYSCEYRWSKFDKRLKQLIYNNNEYNMLLYNDTWTKQETDNLIDLCTKYDCRWYVIYDRWLLLYSELYNKQNNYHNNSNNTNNTVQETNNTLSNNNEIDMTSTSANTNLELSHSTTTIASAPVTDFTQHVHTDNDTSSSNNNQLHENVNHDNNHKNNTTQLKTLQDLKERYYSIQQTLLKHRNGSDIDLNKHVLFSHKYDKPYDIFRIDELNKLLNRTQSDIDDIIPYVLEYRKLTTEIVKLKKHKKFNDMKKNKLIQAQQQMLNKNNPNVNKKRKNSVNDDLSIHTSITADQPLATIPVHILPPQTMLPQPSNNIYLRSQQLYTQPMLNPRLTALMDKQLNILNIKNTKNNALLLNVPTGVVADMYDRLRYDIVLLDNLNRYINELERKRDAVLAVKKQKVK